MKRLLIILLCSTLLLADSAGPNSGTATGAGWASPSNVGASDNAYATYAIAGATIHCPKCEEPTTVVGKSASLSISSLGFAIPASATITGISATFEHKCSGSGSCSTSTSDGGKVQLSKGTNKGSSPTWATIDETETLGSSTDLWGSTWTVADINATSFGMTVVVINSNTSTRTASVDYMALTVYYSPAGTGSHRRVVISETRTIQLHS